MMYATGDKVKFLDDGSIYYVGFNVGYDLSSLCSYKGGAPCRLDGTNYFGYNDVYPDW